MAGTHDQPTEKRQKRAKRVILLVIGLMLVAGLVCNYWPAKGHITISRETTYITSPLNEDGTVNYVAALNERLSKGVTPENNAAPLIIQALDPECFDDRTRQRLFKLLGIAELAPESEYFVELSQYLEAAHAAPAWQRFWDADGEDQEALLARLAEGPWAAKDYPRIAAWIEANEKPLAMIVQATHRPRCYVPLVSLDSPPNVLSVPDSLSPFLKVPQPLAARAMGRLHAGDVDAAVADVLAVHRLARLIGQGPFLIHGLIALTTERTACKATVHLAASGKLSAAEAKAFMAQLEALGPASDIVAAMDQSERFMALDCVMILTRSRDPVRAMTVTEHHKTRARGPVTDAVNWDSMLRTLNCMYDAMVTAQRATEPAEIAKAEDEARAIMRRAVHPGPIETFLCHFGGRAATGARTRMVTNVLLTLVVPTIDSAFDLERAVHMRLKLSRLSLALAAFKAEKGKYPQELSELSPAYVKKVPVDVFAEGPLVYKRVDKGYLLYSVGANMKDDGGQGDDIVVRVK